MMNNHRCEDRSDILIVDDTPANLDLLSQMLTERGYHVRAVTSGTRALLSTQMQLPDLVLLDVKMPQMDGYQVCERLKAEERTRDIPVIFISALDDLQDKVRAFAVGGVDYVTKPFQVEEVLARVEAHLCLRRLQRDLEEMNRRMEQELALAAHVQASFLPSELPRVPGWQLAAMLKPARRTSGDFYDIVPLPNGRLAVVIADVVDKGVEAALFMALSCTLLRAYVRDYADEPEVVLSVVNQRVLTDTRSGQFVSVFLGILDPLTGDLIYSNAGHNPPCVLRPGNGHAPRLLARTGMLLGVMEDATWARRTARLAPGDALLLYTDGATDAQDAQGHYFGEDRLLAVALANAGRTAQETQAALAAAIGEFVGDAEQTDDIALMVVAREPESESS